MLTVAFLVAAGLRELLLRRLTPSQLPDWKLYLFEYSPWAVAGLVVTGWNWWAYGYPVVVSGLKLVVGSLALGVFAAAHAVLDLQRQLPEDRREVDESRYASLSTKMMVLSMVLVVSVSVVLVLLFRKDFKEIRRALTYGRAAPIHEIHFEIAFVAVLLLAGSWLVARAFGRNLAHRLELQLSTLRAVESGDLGREVPVVLDDELGRIAAGTNQMIEGLRERARIKEAFGKYVNPSIVESILSEEGGAALGGRQVEVAVLFSDLRNFTPLSERLPPPELVDFLNRYFTGVVEEIRSRGGVVDKFIGDAAMAVFGLQGDEGCCDAALDAARGMQRFVEHLNVDLRSEGHPEVAAGVGIHYGAVVAGNIGSPDRLEYTVIGDAVNVAARLESVTKELGVRVAVSDVVRSHLSEDRAARLEDLGAHDLKGKSAAVRIHGIR